MQSCNHNKQTFEVLAGVSHDIRNHLQGILGYTEILWEKLGKADIAKAEELLSRIRQNALSGCLLAANYLDLVRLEGGFLSLLKQPVQIDELLRQVAQLYETELERKQMTFEQHYQAQSPIVLGDCTALMQIFSNLLHNALKFTALRGHISLTSTRLNHEVAITIEDTGCGIAQKDLAKVFTNGWRATASCALMGTGLGLFIAKSLIEAHAGRVTVESTLGKGTRFTVFLPCEPL